MVDSANNAPIIHCIHKQHRGQEMEYYAKIAKAWSGLSSAECNDPLELALDGFELAASVNTAMAHPEIREVAALDILDRLEEMAAKHLDHLVDQDEGEDFTAEQKADDDKARAYDVTEALNGLSLTHD